MTSQGSAHGRFTRAIQQRNLWAAESSLRELGSVSLEDALGYLDLLAEQKPEKLERAAVAGTADSRRKRPSSRWRSRSSRREPHDKRACETVGKARATRISRDPGDCAGPTAPRSAMTRKAVPAQANLAGSVSIARIDNGWEGGGEGI